MKNRIIAAVSLFVLSLNLVVPSLADTKKHPAKKARTNVLVPLLPASDAVITMNSGRFLGDSLPKLLAGNQALLTRVMDSISKMQAKTGIDLRQFENVATGITIRKKSPKEFDFVPVAIARGQISAPAVIAAAKLAAKGKYREEKIGSRTLYIFAAKDIAEQHKAKTTDPKKLAMIDRITRKLSAEMAVTAYDANTIVAGTAGRVRETLGTGPRISPDITQFLGHVEGTVMEFAARVPEGMKSMLPIDNDELGRNIDAIRYLYGNFSVAGDGASFRATARTLQPTQAQGLYETLNGLQMLGKVFLGSAKGADKQVFHRMVENVKFAVTGSDVSLELRVPQSDIDVLVGSIK